jgi:hypothetical protein
LKEHLGTNGGKGKNKKKKRRGKRERGYMRQQAKGVGVMMTRIIIRAVQGGGRERAPLGYMKRRGGSGGQIEQKEEIGARPVGLPNINNYCHVSAAIHFAAIERGYNEVTNTQLWEHVNNHMGKKDSSDGPEGTWRSRWETKSPMD